MKIEIITQHQLDNRNYWVDEISRLSGNFGVDAQRVEDEINKEIRENGLDSLLGHLRLCGAIPEQYGYDTSEEKLYSKYTDIIINEAYLSMGFDSIVLKERADVADVECISNKYGFVADAKAFRLSRTAKNQKDFKIQEMDRWKHGKPYAMVVCPVYQLPSRKSQIYQQAGERSVCIFTYTHISVLVRCAEIMGKEKSIDLLHEIFKSVDGMNPSKDATSYWMFVNRTMILFDDIVRDIWREEKIASSESIYVARCEALRFLSMERERIMSLSREDAIKEVIRSRNVEKKMRAVNSVSSNIILELR